MGIKEMLTYSKNLNVLYIEDEEISQELYACIFSDFFSTLDIANNGLEGLDYFTSNEKKYDLVISDICMPYMDGIELSKKILELNPNQIIIVMTAHNEEERIEEIDRIGVQFTIPKPVQNDRLLDILEKASKAAYLQSDTIQ